MVHNFVLTLTVLCSVAALALRQEYGDYALTEEEDDVTECRAVKIYNKAIPHSSINVDSIKALLLTTDLKTCVQACCQRGATVCQYAWLFEGKCLAVSCRFNPAGCHPKSVSTDTSVSTYTSLYVKMGYADGRGTLDKVKPTSRRPVTESTDEVERVEPIDADYQETEAPTQPTHLPTTSKWTESTDEIEGAEPIDTDNQETEAPTKPTHLPTTSKWHRQRPTLTKPVSTVSPGPVAMDTISLAELEDALNSTWKQATPITLTHPPPPSPHTLEYSGGSVSTVNITAVDSSGLYEETNIGLTYVFVLLSCFFGFLFLFFLFLACGYIALRHRGRNQKSKKVSYTVVDHDDQAHKLTNGSKGFQQPSSLVLSDSDTDEGGAMFSMVGATAPRDDAHGKKHTSLASGLLPL